MTPRRHGFLRFLDHDVRPQQLRELRVADVEAFVAKVGARVGRHRIGQVTATLRMFLRFLAATGEGPAGLDAQVDSPRIYRGERLPRALAWETVRTFLRAIDRTTPKGRRDYAMFVLVATYGLRASEVRTLDLDDVEWRSRQIRVPRPKVGTPLLLPLTDTVGRRFSTTCDAAGPSRRDRRLISSGSSSRSVLLGWAPSGTRSIRGHGALGYVFPPAAVLTAAARSGPAPAPRGSLAQDDRRPSRPSKRREHGCYLRLDVDDLRDVALPLPAAAVPDEVRP